MKHILENISARSNQTLDWLPSDTAENYVKKNKFGPNLYQPDTFKYKFNSHGFRCDEFNLTSELPVVFLGCSSTEGIGLPLGHTWAYQLHQKIVGKTDLKIPYWNLALGGTGIDTQAHLLYWLS